MPEIDFLVPYATKNYILNPSFENDSTGWNDVGCTSSVVMTRARFGRKGLKIVTNGAALNEGVYYRISDKSLKGSIFGSVYVRGSGVIRLKLKDGFTGQQSATLSVQLHDQYWTRLDIQGYAEGSDDTRLYVETVDTIQAVTFYIDGAQVELNDYLTTYCDGEQDGCRWEGIKHGSTSTRPNTTVEGGRWVSARDNECDPTTYITTFSGMGLPPITVNRQRMALSPGSFFDSIRTEERLIQFSINMIDTNAQRREGNSKLKLNQLRQFLIDLIKPDNNPNSEPIWMRYRDGDKSLMTKVIYESGLEFDGDFRNKWINAIPLRFLALDPFWYEDSQEVAILDVENALADSYMLAARVDGEWKKVGQGIGNNGGVTERIYVTRETPAGEIYFGGDFIEDGDGANLRYIAKMSDDFSTLEEVMTGLDDVVWDVIGHPSGKVYICGDFLNDNDGNSYTRIVEYDPSTDTFSALGSGISGTGKGMGVAPNGDLYVFGTFGLAGGVAANNVAKWDGGVWERVGNIATDIGAVNYATNIVVISDTEIYVAGNIGTGTIVAKFDGTTWTDLGDSDTFFGYGGGTGDRGYIDRDGAGNIYVAIRDGTNDQGLVYKWNGSSYEQLGSAFTTPLGSSAISKLDVREDGSILVVGNATSIGSIETNRCLFYWNKTNWIIQDVDANYTGYSVITRGNGDIYLGLGIVGGDPAVADLVASGITNVAIKSTTFTLPVFSFEGSGLILWLENQSASTPVYLNYRLQSGEILEIDFRQGKSFAVSNYRGNVSDAVLPASDDFLLLPRDIDGDRTNKVACFIVDEVDPVVQMRYCPTHWSVDAISNQ